MLIHQQVLLQEVILDTGVIFDRAENTNTIEMMISITVMIDNTVITNETVIFAIQVILLPPTSLPHCLVTGINWHTSRSVIKKWNRRYIATSRGIKTYTIMGERKPLATFQSENLRLSNNSAQPSTQRASSIQSAHDQSKGVCAD